MNSHLTDTLLCATLLLAAHSPAIAELTFASTEAQVGLLELYTSEGCSSCPPADRWVSALTGDERLWDEIVPLSFHVDYWDYIGWKDRFASPAFSQRQRRYAADNAVSTVYTPGFLYNGREWRGWFNGRRSEYPQADKTGVLQLTVGDEAADVRFRPAHPEDRELEVTVGLLGFGLSTRVRAGENRGRELRHDFVVLGLQRARLTQAAGRYAVSLPLPESDVEAQRYAVVAWISESRSQAPLQATGGWLAQR